MKSLTLVLRSLRWWYILLVQLLLFIFSMPEYIPSWETFVWVSVIITYLLLGLSTGFKLWAYYLKKKDLLLLCASYLLCFSWLLCSGFISFFIAVDGPFAASYHSTYQIKNNTIYLYDNSFLDPATKIYKRWGFSPWRYFLKQIYNTHPSDLSQKDIEIELTPSKLQVK